MRLKQISYFIACYCFSINLYAMNNNEIVPTRLIKHDLSVPLSTFLSKHQTIESQINLKLSAQLPDTSIIPLKFFQGIGYGLQDYKVNYPFAFATGSVGTTQYVQTVNNAIAVYDKNSGALLPGFPIFLNTIWTGFSGPCENYADGFPAVKYDQLANRWFITQMAFGDDYSGPFLRCVAVSTTEDATGSYYRYAFQMRTKTEFPKIAMWPNAYLMTVQPTDPQGLPVICALDRNKVLIGAPADLQCRTMQTLLLPVDLEGTNLPPQLPPKLIRLYNDGWSGYTDLYDFNIDFTDSHHSSIDFIERYQLPSMGSVGGLSYRPTYRQFSDHGSLLGAFQPSYNQLGVSELRYSNNTDTPVSYQDFHFGPDTAQRDLPSIAMDKQGNIAIGYIFSTSITNHSPALIFQLASDGSFHTQPLLVGYGNAETGTDSTSLSIDPVDGCTFWFTGQYVAAQTDSNNWSTAIIKFTLPGCS